VKPETQNRRLEPTGLAKPGETCELMGTGPGLARHESVDRVVGQVWNRSDPFLWCKPAPLVGYLDQLLTLLILLFLCHLTVTCRIKLNVLAMLQCDLDSRTFTWYVRPLHMHRRIIMSHNLVTEIKKELTHSKIGKQLAFPHDEMSKISVCISILPQTQEPSPSLCRNPIAIC